MNNRTFRGHRPLAAVALLILICCMPLHAWCGNENLWVSFESGGGIVSYTSGQLKKSGMPTPVQLSTFGEVLGLAFDKSHNLWADVRHFQVVRFTPEQLKNLKNDPSPTPGVVITSTSSLNNILGCNFDQKGDLWMVDVSADTLNEISKAQLAAGSGDITPAIVITLSGLIDPNVVTFDKAGNAWVDDPVNAQIAEFSASQLKSSGTKTPAVLLTDDGSGTSLSSPGEIAFDKKGNLWVANLSSNTVVEYAKGQLASSGNPTPKVKLSSAIFDLPFGAAFDSKGDLVVANIFDTGTIVKFTAKQLNTSGAPIPKVVVTPTQTNSYQITFGPAF
jgi:sugar lactone lactonase YvrE